MKSSILFLFAIIILSACTTNKPKTHSCKCTNTNRAEITDVVNKLFYYTDNLMWDELLNQVLAEKLHFDVTSVGAEKAEELMANTVTEMWDTGLKDLDAVHHQVGNYIIEISKDTAKVKCYSIASHYKSGAQNGTTREFIGDYDLVLIKLESGWRINSFVYNLKYITGNIELN